ncbi:hypothetical protein ACWGCI_10785 [Streptomyces sp. NPDC054949]|uniref:hypothetical protein n=1 Tax=unclassified Streptomyces TaxID=2593676 RepID=UPI00225704B9|nr:hypothetical protein [Streptomyces sp. NBC_00424]MCX5079160.1 hypothetical protein [Streptomyces sp. NBC_00424]WUD39277.1 hypothetical protein OHA84_01495 [Streptomyces sp. NBC_00513]
MRFASTRGSRDTLDTTLVRPELMTEISADTATAIDRGGAYRHPLRFKRLRLDVTTADVPRFGVRPRPEQAAAGAEAAEDVVRARSSGAYVV